MECKNCQKGYSKNPEEALKIMGIVKIIIGIISFVAFVIFSATVFKNTVFTSISLILGVVSLVYGVINGTKQYFEFR